MSPLARPLLALAAAATLLAVCAAGRRYDRQYENRPGLCTSEMGGQTTIIKISQKPVVKPAGVAVIDVTNDCAKMELDLVGEMVTACSRDVPPVIEKDPWPAYTPIIINSGDDTKTDTTVYIDQFCKAKP